MNREDNLIIIPLIALIKELQCVCIYIELVNLCFSMGKQTHTMLSLIGCENSVARQL